MTDDEFKQWAHANGGLAFPSVYTNEGGNKEIWPGMTLRDHFAGQALAAMGPQMQNHDADWVARFAYRCADEMLKVRS